MNFIIYLYIVPAQMESHQNYSVYFLASPRIFIKLVRRDDPKSPQALTVLCDENSVSHRDTRQRKYRPS